MNTWTPLWSTIVESSLWQEDGEVVKVFMTLLARKDADQICRLDAFRIGRLCNLDELRVLDILKILASPDPRRKISQEYDGRRIKAVEGGWLILNGLKYREMVKREIRLASWRRAQAKQREKKKAAKRTPEERKTEMILHEKVQKSVQNLSEFQSRIETEQKESVPPHMMPDGTSFCRDQGVG